MRHGRKVNHLGRTHEHRLALMSNLANSLILNKRIKTTVAKAKALQQYIDPIITRSKDDSTHSHRMVFKYLQNKYAVTELFHEVSTKVSERPGGYTRIIKLGNRLGDGAESCYIELVDFNEVYGKTAKPAAKKTSSRRGGKKSKKVATDAEVVTEAPKAEAAE